MMHTSAISYVIHPDGRVVVNHSSASWENVYNFFGVLREHSNMSEEEILELSEKFKEGYTDAMLVKLDGKNYYLVYEKSNIQDWIFLGLVYIIDWRLPDMNGIEVTRQIRRGNCILREASVYV